jgi:hypothetical protein
MRKLVLVSALAATSAVAVAGDYKINIEGRSDLTMNTAKTTVQAGTSTTTKYTSFKNNLVRLNAVATVNDSLSLRFRYRFTKPETAIARENSSDMLDFLYVDHKNAFFTTRFGKQSWSEAMGRETFVSGSDTFLTSSARSNFTTDVGEYRFGATAKFAFEGHNLGLSLSNPNKAYTAVTGESKNNSVAYGVTYSSSLMDKMIQPTLAYTLAPQDGDTGAAAAAKTKKGNYSLWAAGVRSEVAGATIDADYKTYTRANRNDGTNTSAVKETTKSIYVNAAYTVNEFTPFVSYINDKYTKEAAAASDFKKDQMAFGLMYKPFADANFRYHLAYTNSTQKFSDSAATNKEVKDTNILFGIKADI